MLRVALVGCGHIAQSEHLPNWRAQPGAEVVGVVDQRSDLARNVGSAYGLPWYASLGELLAAREVDAIHVSSSLRSHVPLINEAAAAGKHVLVEKPLAESAAAGLEAVRIAESAGVVLMVGCQKLSDADVTYLGDLIRSGELGTLMAIHSVFRISQVPTYVPISEVERVPFLPGSEHDPTDLRVRMLDQSIHHFNLFNTWFPGGLAIDDVRRHAALWSITAHGPAGTVISHFNAAASGHGEEFWAYFERGSVHVQIWSPHFSATHGEIEVMPTGAEQTYRPTVPLINPYLAMLRTFMARIEEPVGWLGPALTAVEDLRTVERIVAAYQAP